MKPFYTILFTFFTVTLAAQVPVASYSGVNNTAATTNNSMLGWPNAIAPYDNSTTYNMFYGREDAATTGQDRLVNSFSIASGASAGVYTPVLYEAAKPFDTVIVKRINNATTTGRRVNALYELGSFDAGSNSLYLRTSYSATMEDLVNTRFINIGSDNMFVNNASTENNIERIDLIFSSGIAANTADLSKVGILINERGGNDFFKAAAITGIDAAKKVTSLGNLISIVPTDWGQVGPIINTVVMSKEESDLFLRPKEDIGPQNISGVFISLQDLGITGNTFIRGVSLFPNDVTPANDLVGLTDVPTNTVGGSIGGLDMMAGGGFYREVGTGVILPIKFVTIAAQNLGNSRAKITWVANADHEHWATFYIERSAIGMVWEIIGTQTVATQNGANQSFDFIDNDPTAGKNYYRVKSMGPGNKPTYSKIVYIDIKSVNDKAGIFFSPGQNQVWIKSGNNEGRFIARLFNFNGQLLQQQSFYQARHSVKQFNFGRITANAFIIQVYNAGNVIAVQQVTR